jgi:hypothetical protein
MPQFNTTQHPTFELFNFHLGQIPLKMVLDTLKDNDVGLSDGVRLKTPPSGIAIR